MTNREKLQALAERKQRERREEFARREKAEAEEILHDLRRTTELVEFFRDDVTGFRLIGTDHEIFTTLVEGYHPYELVNDGVPYVEFSIRDDEYAPGLSIPIMFVRFRRGHYECRSLRRDATLDTLDELRESVHGEVADMEVWYVGIAIVFAQSTCEKDNDCDDDFDDDLDDDFDDDFDDDHADEGSGLPHDLAVSR